MFRITLPAGFFGDSFTVVSQNRDTLLSLPDITLIVVTDTSVAFLESLDKGASLPDHALDVILYVGQPLLLVRATPSCVSLCTVHGIMVSSEIIPTKNFLQLLNGYTLVLWEFPMKSPIEQNNQLIYFWLISVYRDQWHFCNEKSPSIKLYPTCIVYPAEHWHHWGRGILLDNRRRPDPPYRLVWVWRCSWPAGDR